MAKKNIPVTDATDNIEFTNPDVKVTNEYPLDNQLGLDHATADIDYPDGGVGEFDDDLEAIEEERLEKLKEDALRTLGKNIETKLKSRMSNRQIKESEWTECANLYYGSMGVAGTNYGETPFASKPMSRARPGFNIVRTKCDAAIAQCVSMQFGVGEKNWDIWPSANSVDPADPVKCAIMSDDIETQLDKCRYAYQVRQAIEDRIIYGTGILKGPVNTGKMESDYVQGMTGTWMNKSAVSYVPFVERVNPWYFYPDDSTNDSNFLLDAIEIHPMSKIEVAKLRKHQGYIAKNIDEALETSPAVYTSEFFTEYANLTASNPNLFKNKYCVIEYHGPITKSDLQDIGIPFDKDIEATDFYGEVWVVNGHVIRADIENLEGTFETPYAVAPWKGDPSSVFGFGHPLTMRDQQRVVTQTWHMILDNAAISSGPQMAIQKRFIQPADGDWEMSPRKTWHLTDPTMKVSDAVEFFFPPNVIQNIIPVLDMARQFSEEESATPMLAAGMQSPQTGETATGSLMAQQNSTTLLDLMSEQWDDQVTEKIIRRMYAWNMVYGSNELAKGNYVIDVRSSNEYKNKQMHVRDVERLSMEVAQNPEMAKWVNMDSLTQTRLSMMNLPSRNIIRSEEEAQKWAQEQQQKAQEAQQNDPNFIKAQAELAKIEVAKMQIQLDAQKMQMDQEIAMAKLQMEHESNMVKNQIAMLEADALSAEAESVAIAAQLTHEAKMVELNLRAQELGLKYSTEAAKTDASNQTSVFLAGMAQENKTRELNIYEEEIKLKKAGGTGI